MEALPFVVCAFCGEGFGLHSLLKHESMCRAKWRAYQLSLPANVRLQDPNTTLPSIAELLNMTPDELAEFNSNQQRIFCSTTFPCEGCGLRFEKHNECQIHSKICPRKPTSQRRRSLMSLLPNFRSDLSKAGIARAFSRRHTSTQDQTNTSLVLHPDDFSEAALRASQGKKFVCFLCELEFDAINLPIHQAQCRRNWTEMQSTLPPRLQTKMPQQPICETGALQNLTAEQTQNFNTEQRRIHAQLKLKCPHCYRTFEESSELTSHVIVCCPTPTSSGNNNNKPLNKAGPWIRTLFRHQSVKGIQHPPDKPTHNNNKGELQKSVSRWGRRRSTNAVVPRAIFHSNSSASLTSEIRRRSTRVGEKLMQELEQELQTQQQQQQQQQSQQQQQKSILINSSISENDRLQDPVHLSATQSLTAVSKRPTSLRFSTSEVVIRVGGRLPKLLKELSFDKKAAAMPEIEEEGTASFSQINASNRRVTSELTEDSDHIIALVESLNRSSGEAASVRDSTTTDETIAIRIRERSDSEQMMMHRQNNTNNTILEEEDDKRTGAELFESVLKREFPRARSNGSPQSDFAPSHSSSGDEMVELSEPKETRTLDEMPSVSAESLSRDRGNAYNKTEEERPDEQEAEKSVGPTIRSSNNVESASAAAGSSSQSNRHKIVSQAFSPGVATTATSGGVEEDLTAPASFKLSLDIVNRPSRRSRWWNPVTYRRALRAAKRSNKRKQSSQVYRFGMTATIRTFARRCVEARRR